LIWSKQEIDALTQGVALHGVGKWTVIKNCPIYGPKLLGRTANSLGDKWYNMLKVLLGFSIIF